MPAHSEEAVAAVLGSTSSMLCRVAGFEDLQGPALFSSYPDSAWLNAVKAQGDAVLSILSGC